MKFCTKRSASQSFGVLQEMEYQVFWLYKEIQDFVDENNNDCEFTATKRKLLNEILAFRDIINTNSEFVVHKTLKGDEVIFSCDWDRKNIDANLQNAYRKQRMVEFVESIHSDNSDVWLTRLKRCANSEYSDEFVEFLKMLGERKSLIVIKWLNNLDENLECLISDLLVGLINSDEKEAVNKLVYRLISENRYLPQIAKAQLYSNSPDMDILRKTARTAIKQNDSESLAIIVITVIKFCARDNFTDLQNLGLNCIKHCTNLENTSWVNRIGAYIDSTAFLDQLDHDQIQLILENVKLLSNLDYSAQKLLEKIANNSPELVVELLIKRILIEQDQSKPEYIAIPYKFHLFGKALQHCPEIVVKQTRIQF